MTNLTDYIQFDSMGQADAFESDSEDEDESLTVPKPSDEYLVRIHPNSIIQSITDSSPG
jgi:hypothetical protein